MLGRAGLTAGSADWADGEHVQQRNVVESELVGCGVAQTVALRHRRCSHRPVGGHIRAVGLAVADDLCTGFSPSQLWKLLAETADVRGGAVPAPGCRARRYGRRASRGVRRDGCRCRAVGYGAGRQRQRCGCRCEEDKDRAVTSWRVLRAGRGGIRGGQRRGFLSGGRRSHFREAGTRPASRSGQSLKVTITFSAAPGVSASWKARPASEKGTWWLISREKRCWCSAISGVTSKISVG